MRKYFIEMKTFIKISFILQNLSGSDREKIIIEKVVREKNFKLCKKKILVV